MVTATVVQGGRVIDPANGIDRVADLVVDGALVLGVDVPVPAGAAVIDARGWVVTPGWVDGHTHVFGDIGLDDPDTAGVLSGVTTLIDAGSSGSLTLDELAERAATCRTDVYAIVMLDRRGIADTTSIPTSVAEIPNLPLGELRRAIDRHADRVVAVKAGIYADLGRAWTRLALAAADLLGQRAFFHIGNFRTHRSADVGLMRDFLGQLRPGDVVTHCYTGAPGGLVDDGGGLLPEALAAAERGVAFDVGHSGNGFDPSTARRLLAEGLRPTTVSSDIAVINVRQRVRSLAHVLANVAAVGFDLPELVAMITANPCRLYGLPGGSFSPGAPADVTAFEVLDDALIPDRLHPTLPRPTFRVRATIKAGEVVPVDLDAVMADANIRFQLLAPPGAPRRHDAAAAALLHQLATCLPYLPLDGEVLQQAVTHLGGEVGLSAAEAAAVTRRAFADRDGGNQVGWLLAEQCASSGRREVVDRLARAAASAAPAFAAAP